MGLEETFMTFLHEHHKNMAARAHVIGKAVNVGDQYCDVEIDDAPTIHDVAFCTIHDAVSNRIVVSPKEGSRVLVGYIEANEQGKEIDAFIEQCSEIDKFFLKIGNKQYELTSSGHLIKGGNDTLKEVVDLMIAAQKLTIEACQQILVLYGNNPNFQKLAEAYGTKLQQATQKANNIFQ